MRNKSFTCSLIAVICLTCITGLHAAPRKTSFSKQTYQKKAAYEGLGKKSKVTGLPKTKPVNGHCKKTTKGYTYVNPYVKSR